MSYVPYETSLPAGMLPAGRLTYYKKKRFFSNSESRGYANRFKTHIVKSINAGIPPAWVVILGKIKEKPPIRQAAGSHMRLIVGYNNDTSEILYSDSWGRGHELKRMKREDAWTITLGLYTLEPQK